MPWNDVIVIGTTFVPQKEPNFNPEASEEEINHIVNVTRKHVEFPFDKSFVRSTYAGLRAMPTLLRPGSAGKRRAHSQPVFTEFGNLVTAAGGSWNLYRKVAEAAMTEAVESGLMYKRPCPTEFLSIYRQSRFNPDQIERDLINGKDVLPEVLDYAKYCKEEEYAITVEDFLYRRLRIARLSPQI
ncbi:MAG: glycerol-3-phosphate dehydrogenase, partial [Burkholderiales bacterium]|nr:glycerol-3-phosphate dehydrogenase [Burkholderiales bacterium]